MAIFQKKQLVPGEKVWHIPVDLLRPNPNQPRAVFGQEALEELAASIAQHGILQPLTVRAVGGGEYELIAGERRLRAARLAGLGAVPCIIVAADDRQSSLLALVENLQRRDLDFLEEALALSQLISLYHLTQEEAAQRLGKSQSAVANLLRLLRLDPNALTLLRREGFSQRHARALLRLPEEEQLRAAQYVVAKGLTVAATEQYVDRLLAPPPPKNRGKIILRDVRLFLNSLSKNLKVVQEAGIPARCQRAETEDAITLTIVLPKGNVSRET